MYDLLARQLEVYMSIPLRVQRFSEHLYRAIDHLGAALMALLLVEVTALIVTRQMGLSWVWIYDVTRWTLIWLVFFGAVPLTGRGDHLTVEVAEKSLPARARRVAAFVVALTSFCVAVLIMYYGGLEVLRMYHSAERSMSGSLPAFLGYSVLPLAFALLALASLAHLFEARSSAQKSS